MEFYLFNCRPLKIVSNNTNLPGSVAIYTAFQPKHHVCCDIIIFFSNDEEIGTQCTMIEETPQLLDSELDADMLEMFNLFIEENEFQKVYLTKSVARNIIDNAIPIEDQLVTH